MTEIGGKNDGNWGKNGRPLNILEKTLDFLYTDLYRF